MTRRISNLMGRRSSDKSDISYSSSSSSSSSSSKQKKASSKSNAPEVCAASVAASLELARPLFRSSAGFYAGHMEPPVLAGLSEVISRLTGTNGPGSGAHEAFQRITSPVRGGLWVYGRACDEGIHDGVQLVVLERCEKAREMLVCARRVLTQATTTSQD